MKDRNIIREKQRGFTLIEVVMVIAIIAILLTIAVPAINGWLPNYRLRSAARAIYSDFQRAKFAAVKEREDVVISFTPAAFTPSGREGSYTVFVDDGTGPGGIKGNDIREPNSTERILTQVTMPKQVSLISATFAGTTTPGYNPRGLPLSGRLGNVQLKNSNLRRYRASLSIAGRVRLRTSIDDGVTWDD